MIEKRPWGMFEILLDSDNCKVKRITVKPGGRLSYQYHHKRSEHWVIASGEAKVFVEGKIKNLKKGDSIDIPIKAKHYIQNSSSDKLIVIETQLGDYFGEDDIIRLDDPYNR